MRLRETALTLSITALTFVALIALVVPPGTANATEGWDWWEAVYAQQNHKQSCPATPPTKTAWDTALGTGDDPHWSELTVFFIAYPCGGDPDWFVEFRNWLNYEIHSVGSWDSEWEGYVFYKLKDLAYELDESPAGFWDDGPWQ